MLNSRSILLLLAVLLLFAPPVRAADTTATFQSRDYIVHTPPSWTKNGLPSPVVFALHGGGGNAQSMAEQYGLNQQADRYHMIVVYPNGSGGILGKLHTWNAGGCCGGAKKKNSDDVAYLSALIDQVVVQYNADPTKVFFTGHSNGSMMSYRMACAVSDKITAIAPVGGQDTSGCLSGNKVPILHIHGTLDACAKYNGGESCGGCFSRVLGLGGNDTWACDDVHQSLEKHAALNGCRKSDTIASFNNGLITCESWDRCKGGEVKLCSIHGGGHLWQGTIGLPACQKRPDGNLCKKWIEAVGPIVPGIDVSAMVIDYFATFINQTTSAQ